MTFAMKKGERSTFMVDRRGVSIASASPVELKLDRSLI